MPDSVVWIHNRPDYAAAIEADVRATGAKLVVHLHNSLLVSFPRKITASFRADRVVFCSRYLENEARSVFPALDRTSVIYNGADESRFYPRQQRKAWSGEKAPVVLFAGRLVPEKGAHVFVEAMWLLAGARDSSARTAVGSDRIRLSQYARPDIRVRSCGMLRRTSSSSGYRAASQLAEEFRRADIFCSPSVWEEPFGLVNVEAMASGLPVVSTRGGGVPEIFACGGGVLVERGSATELAAALEELIRR